MINRVYIDILEYKNYYSNIQEIIVEIKVEIAKDETRAFITVIPIEESLSDTLTVKDLKEKLETKGVIFGIDEQILAGICHEKIYDRIVSVAQAKAPTVGENAEINILKQPVNPDDVKPPTNEEGDIDYFAAREGLITYIRKDEIVAQRIPPTIGAPGTSVTGKEIPGIPGADKNLVEVRGAGTVIDGDNLLAEHDGVITLKSGVIHIEKVFRIRDDLGMNTGSIALPKDLDLHIVIEKDIVKGFKLECRNATINGCIEDATVDSVNLKVMGGIVGKGEEVIKADVLKAGYINGKRKIIANKYLFVNREISSGAIIYADKVRAYAIQGSHVVAKKAIWTEYLNGNNDIFVGVDYQAKEELDYIYKELAKLQEPLEQVKNTYFSSQKRMTQLKSLMKINPKHPILMKELPKIKEITEKFKKIKAIQTNLEEKREVLSAKLYPIEDPLLVVRAGFSRDRSSNTVVDPHTLIHMCEYIKKVTEATDGGLFYIKKERIWQTYTYNAKEAKTKFENL